MYTSAHARTALTCEKKEAAKNNMEMDEVRRVERRWYLENGERMTQDFTNPDDHTSLTYDMTPGRVSNHLQ